MKRGEIWLVNLDPTIGHEYKKTRPSVIIQNDVGNKYSPITIIAPITSQKTDKVYPVEVLLPEKIIGEQGKIALNQIRAIDKRRCIKKLGKVTDLIQDKVNEALIISLGLKPL